VVEPELAQQTFQWHIVNQTSQTAIICSNLSNWNVVLMDKRMSLKC